MSRDLTCNETLTMEDTDRGKDTVGRRYVAPQTTSQPAFRVNYTSTQQQNVKYSVQKPTTSVRAQYTVANPQTSRVIHATHSATTSNISSTSNLVHRQYTTPTSNQPQHPNNSGPKLFKPFPDVSTTEYGTSNIPSSSQPPGIQLQLIAGANQLLRNAAAAAGREERPASVQPVSSHATQANLYGTINTMRLQQQHHIPSSTKSTGAAALAAVQQTLANRGTTDNMRNNVYHPQTIFKNIVQQPQVTQVSRPNSVTSPHITNRYTAVQNGVKHVVSPTNIQQQSVPQNVLSPQPIQSPSRIITSAHGAYNLPANSITATIPTSPGPPSTHVIQAISTPSPRPSILRKRGDGAGTPGSVAKRRLPFMEEHVPTTSGNGCLSTVTPPVQPVKEIRAIIQMASTSEVQIQRVENGYQEESPRKRVRKQQFDQDQTPEQIKMAISVMQPPIGSSLVWKLSGHPNFQTPGSVEKKKRGRPRGDSRPATALPMDMQIQQSVNVFVDLDSPEERLKNIEKNIDLSGSFTPTVFLNRTSAASVPPVHLDTTIYTKKENYKPKKKQDQNTAESSKGLKPYAKWINKSPSVKTVKKLSAKKNKSTSNALMKHEKKVKDYINESKAIEKVINSETQCSLSEENKRAENTAAFLAKCLVQNKIKQEIQQDIDKLDPEPSCSNALFDKSYRGDLSPPLQYSQKNRKISIMNGMKLNDDLRANHFESIEMFDIAYDRHKQLRRLRKQEMLLRRKEKIRIRKEAMELLKQGEMTLDKYCNWTGLRRPEKFDKASKKLMIGMMERTLIERIARFKNKKLGLCGKLDKNSQNGKPRLLMPTVKAVDDTFNGIVRDIVSEGHVTDKDNLICDEQRVIIEQLLDEMLAFLSKEDNPNEVTECAERTLTRMQTSSVIANCCDFNNYNTKQRLKARQSRARLIRCESYPSVLKKLYKSSDTSHEVEWGRNVFSAGREYHNESWWNVVSRPKKKLRKVYKERKLTEDSDLPPEDNEIHEVNPRRTTKIIKKDIEEIKKEEFNLRLEQMNHRVDEQICLEEEVLDFFDKFLKIYDPNGHFKMTLDMERDYEDGDSEENIRQKRYQRLRYVLMLPPGERVRDKKPDFGDNCSSIINNPSEIAMNNLMTGLSPFWKGPMLPSNKKGFYITRTGKRMHDKDEDFVPLEDDYNEYYIEEVVEYADPERFQKDCADFEAMWAHLKDRRISPPPVSNFNGTSVISPTGISRRTLSRLKDKSVQYLGTVNNQPAKPQVFLLDSMEDENVATLRAQASVSREILATAFKAIRQTTLMMVQSRDAILNHIADQRRAHQETPQCIQTAHVTDDDAVYNRQLERAIQESLKDQPSTSRT